MKGYLLDTHIVLWWFTAPERLPADLHRALTDGSTTAFVSAAAVWEIAIKSATGRLRMPANLLALLKEDHFSVLPITAEHALGVEHLPLIHQDPFDRIQIVQAMQEDLTLVTADPHIRAYQVRTWSI